MKSGLGWMCRSVFALCASGLATLSGSAPAVSRPAAPVAATPEEAAGEDDIGASFSERESEARALIFDEHRRLAGATHYEALGVAANASPEEIKKGYLAAAKRFHSDACRQHDSG